MANRGLNFHFPEEYHDYKRNKRDVVYDFFGVAFGLPKLPADAADVTGTTTTRESTLNLRRV